MDGPLPIACKTAFAWFDGDAKAGETYEGGYVVRGEAEEPCLARLYPDYEALTADGRFEELAEQLFRPVHDWIGTQVTAEPHSATAATAATAEPA